MRSNLQSLAWKTHFRLFAIIIVCKRKSLDLMCVGGVCVMWGDEHAHACRPVHKHVEPRDQCSDIFLTCLWCPVPYGFHRPHYIWIPPGWWGGWELRASGLCSRCFTNWAIPLESFESIFSKLWKRKSYQLSSRDSQSNDDPSTSNFFLFSLL